MPEADEYGPEEETPENARVYLASLVPDLLDQRLVHGAIVQDVVLRSESLSSRRQGEESWTAHKLETLWRLALVERNRRKGGQANLEEAVDEERCRFENEVALCVRDVGDVRHGAEEARSAGEVLLVVPLPTFLDVRRRGVDGVEARLEGPAV